MRTRLRQLGILAILLAAAGCAFAGPMGVTPAQKDQLKGMAAETRGKMMRGRDDLMRARDDLYRVYGVYDLDERKARAAVDRVGKSQLALLNLHLDNQTTLRRILSESQFAEFRQRLSSKMHGDGARMWAHMEEALFEGLPDRRMMESIGAEPDQIKRLIRSRNPREMRPVVEKLRRESRQLIDVYSRYSLDVQAARKLIDSIHQSQLDLAAANLKMQQTLRTILTSAQFDRLQEELAKRPKPGERARQHHRRF